MSGRVEAEKPIKGTNLTGSRSEGMQRSKAFLSVVKWPPTVK